MRRFARKEDGAAAIEFGMVAAPFFALLFAILETAFVFFAGQTLENAVGDSSRLIMTGQAQSQGMNQSTFKDAVCARVYGLFDCQNGVHVDVKTYPSFATVDLTTPLDANGNFQNNQTFSPVRPATLSWSGCSINGRSTSRCCRTWPATSGFWSPPPRSATSRSARPPRHRPAHEFGHEKFRIPVRPVTTSFSRFAATRSGMAAVEFAMLLPLMVTLYLAAVETSQAVAIQRKVTLTARTVADLASQTTSINNTDMTNMLNAASAVVAPFAAAAAQGDGVRGEHRCQRCRQGRLER